MKIGAIVESFKLPFDEAIKEAKALGASGLQMYADRFLPLDASAQQVKDFRKKVEDIGLCFSAICGDFGCAMYYTRNRELIDKEKRILDQALELGTNIVTTHIGVVPDDENCPQYESMHEVCRELADYANANGGHFAVETGPETAVKLKAFLDKLGSKGVAVNFDPANLVMCAGDNPVTAAQTLKDYIVHTHAKDGIQLKPVDTRTLYCPKFYGLEQNNWDDYILEVPLGKGNVPWNEYLATLKSIGYDGFLTIERECGETPVNDITEAANFLKQWLKKY